MARFRRQFQATLNVDGYAAIRVAPSGKTWTVTSISVNVSTVQRDAKFTVQANYLGDAYIVDSTRNGSRGDTSDTVHYVNDGDCLYLVWTDGDIGSIATATIAGEESS